jgi:hypothetical protein
VPYRAHPRAHPRARHRRPPRLFPDWAHPAAGEDLTLVGDPDETAVLYDAYRRVALGRGFRIGDPLPEAVLRDAERHLAASDRALYANPAGAASGCARK